MQIWCEVLSKEANERYTKDNHSPGKYRSVKYMGLPYIMKLKYFIKFINWILASDTLNMFMCMQIEKIRKIAMCRATLENVYQFA